MADKKSSTTKKVPGGPPVISPLFGKVRSLICNNNHKRRRFKSDWRWINSREITSKSF
jgi:hypothetical protein